MVAFLTMIVVMLIAFTTNLGKLVTEKIAMQNAIDMAVYSGAATQAGYMNKLRKINDDIWKIHDRTRNYLDDSEGTVGIPHFYAKPIPYCAVGPDAFPGSIGKAAGAEARIGIEKGLLQGKEFEFKTMNSQAPMQVENATKDAADQNYSGTRGKVNIKSTMSMGGGLIPVSQKPIHWSYKSWGTVSLPCNVCALCGQMIGSKIVEQTTVNSWFYRSNVRGEIHVAAGIENATPNSNFLDGTYLGQFFGGNCRYGGGGTGRCAMSVYAAAHPHQGKLGSIHPSDGGTASWETQWETRLNDPNPMKVDMQSPMADHQPFDKNYYDYKVRFVGIFESDLQSLGGSPIAPMMGSYGNKMEH